ncbi:hypothetical protein PITC_028420 [Penicillium italicum]|uniref:Uncharacterized protein n=1 Tax=Penicillium italicum TaxID=40296 RepID=A0A0A2KVM5_PENIT|nr:hypothetical protein PITC_028420 [Penicillium italicum]
MRPHKILGNYGHNVGLVSDRMPSGGGCIRLVSTGPPRNPADADVQDIESHQPLLKAQGKRVKVDVNSVAVHHFPRDVSLGKRSLRGCGRWVSLVFEDDIAVTWSAAVAKAGKLVK